MSSHERSHFCFIKATSSHPPNHPLTLSFFFFLLYTGRSEMGVQRVLQVDLKMESFPEPLGSRWMAWQVEYPASRAATQEAETEIRVAQEDLVGIVPLAMVSHAPLSSVPHPKWRLHTQHSQCGTFRRIRLVLASTLAYTFFQHMNEIFLHWKCPRVAALLIITGGSLEEKIHIHAMFTCFNEQFSDQKCVLLNIWIPSRIAPWH